MSKPKKPKFVVNVQRKHWFTAEITADSLEEALETARKMDIDVLLDAPGETIDSEFRITGVDEA